MNMIFNVKAFTTGKIYKTIRDAKVQKFLNDYHPVIAHVDKLDHNRPLIFITNHNHVKDQELTMASTDKVIHWQAKKEYFDAKASLFKKDNLSNRLKTAILVRAMGCIRVDRSDTLPILARKYEVSIEEIMYLNNLTEPIITPGQILIIPRGEELVKHQVYQGKNTKAFLETDRYLAYGHSIGGFPEGTRGEGEALGKFATGLIITAMKNDVEIQPAALSGSFDKNNNDLMINFLDPVKISKNSNPETEAEYLREMVGEGLEENRKLIKTLSPSNLKKLGKEAIYI